MASEVHRKSPSGAKARRIGAGSGTAQAAPSRYCIQNCRSGRGRTTAEADLIFASAVRLKARPRYEPSVAFRTSA